MHGSVSHTVSDKLYPNQRTSQSINPYYNGSYCEYSSYAALNPFLTFSRRSDPSGIEISGDEWAEFIKTLCERLTINSTFDVTELIYSILNVSNRDELGINAKYYLSQGLVHILSTAKAENKDSNSLKLIEHA